jgi:hypothetical protein
MKYLLKVHAGSYRVLAIGLYNLKYQVGGTSLVYLTSPPPPPSYSHWVHLPPTVLAYYLGCQVDGWYSHLQYFTVYSTRV